MERSKFVKTRIAEAFAEFELTPGVPEDIAFHMTDWEEDLFAFVHLYESAERLSNNEIREMIIKFLTHVPNHVAAAKKLAGVGPIEDIFEVGALLDDE